MISSCDFMGVKPADIDAMLVSTQSALLTIPPYHHFGNEPSVSLFDPRDETLITPHEEYAHLYFECVNILTIYFCDDYIILLI